MEVDIDSYKIGAKRQDYCMVEEQLSTLERGQGM